MNGFFYSDETIIDPTLPIHVLPMSAFMMALLSAMASGSLWMRWMVSSKGEHMARAPVRNQWLALLEMRKLLFWSSFLGCWSMTSSGTSFVARGWRTLIGNPA